MTTFDEYYNLTEGERKKMAEDLAAIEKRVKEMYAEIDKINDIAQAPKAETPKPRRRNKR